jgi:hypothetical protein
LFAGGTDAGLMVESGVTANALKSGKVLEREFGGIEFEFFAVEGEAALAEVQGLLGKMDRLAGQGVGLLSRNPATEFAEVVNVNGRSGKLKCARLDGSFREAEDFGGGRVLDSFSFGESFDLALGSIANVEGMERAEVSLYAETARWRSGKALTGFGENRTQFRIARIFLQEERKERAFLLF